MIFTKSQKKILNSLKLNAEYASTHGAYWMIYGITGSFASVFMLAKGYSNMHIGITMAAANLLALGLHGPEVGRTLDALLDAVINGEVPNEKVSLLEHIRTL